MDTEKKIELIKKLLDVCSNLGIAIETASTNEAKAWAIIGIEHNNLVDDLHRMARVDSDIKGFLEKKIKNYLKSLNEKIPEQSYIG